MPLGIALASLQHGDQVRGVVPVKAAVKGGAGGIARVEFWADGRRQATVSRAPYRFGWDTSKLRAGTHHRVTGVAFDRAAGRAQATMTVSAALIPPGGPAAQSGATWTGGFEDGTFDQWSWWKRAEFDAHEFGVVPSGTDGVEAHTGSKLAKFETTREQRDSGRQHAKLYKEWAVGGPELSWRSDAGTALGRLPGSGRDASGTYSAWYFLPADVRWTGDWSNIFQFKRVWPVGDGSVSSEPVWWVDLMAADGWGADVPRRADGTTPASGQPVLVASNMTMKRADGSDPDWRARMVSPPVGRWFQISASIDRDRSIEFALDGKPWFRGTRTDWPAGIGPTPTHAADDASGWIFGAGLYGGPGRLYLDDPSFSPAR